ncbi:5'-methylthioadenosine/S-adenosylhomocysteine nucleosidase [Hymenobacter sp. ASUV-10]|uniref:5'-methylthioadenosine/S-adenosylhomocysteine nucleosidase n=1 Tax=Hymenobacter aranciens TaxID=3063996 RepID=A0ABT9BJ85_9BACT|nr:5'-methylthioadenosine/S-adenosylhomocysteine nucleosidase [Hymenobacter sp. ASUV-10]MDO7877733.1 5'-methylthioadenosine/S-adenosylhomocysteine nucleosidase [Hymenobacter sp. ASUV-10]
MKTDLLIITALALEFNAVARLLSDTESVRHVTGAIYKRGTFAAGTRNFSVAVVEAGAGNVNAAQETERALTFFQPEYIFFVGVAGGLKDVAIGDVVISSEVIHYEGGKAGDVYKPRLSTYPANYELTALAKSIAREASWQHRIDDGLGTFKAEVKPIAAGEKVVASERSATYELINQAVSQALAVEMEGFGFLAPIHAHHKKGIVIRGISDLLEDKAAADAGGSQPLAARNAATFLAGMLVELAKTFPQPENAKSLAIETHAVVTAAFVPAATPPLDNAGWRHRVAKVLAELYEAGPTESSGAWKRAGGKVGFLSNSSSVESQWFAALERLAQGGAGDITIESLLKAVREDFSSNPAIKKFCQDISVV